MWITRKRSSASKALQLLRSHLGPGEQCLAPVWSPSQFSQAAPPGSLSPCSLHPPPSLQPPRDLED